MWCSPQVCFTPGINLAFSHTYKRPGVKVTLKALAIAHLHVLYVCKLPVNQFSFFLTLFLVTLNLDSEPTESLQGICKMVIR